MLFDSTVSLRKVLETGGGFIRLARSPATGELYVLQTDQGVFRLVPGEDPELSEQQGEVQFGLGEDPGLSLVARVDQIGGRATGMAFGPDGTAYLVLNERLEGSWNRASVRRGVPDGRGGFAWSTVATTDPIPSSGTVFDHQFNGIVVSPDGRWLFVNSGSRTDHGEEQSVDGTFPGAREVPLTAAIFRLPADGVDLLLPNDDAALGELGYVYARGMRNAYDLAFAPNGDLFAAENGPDADFPDELNWVREGLHYGFPWRFGVEDNPQQFPEYDGEGDRRLQGDFEAVRRGFYRSDPDFPPAPGRSPIRSPTSVRTQWCTAPRTAASATRRRRGGRCTASRRTGRRWDWCSSTVLRCPRRTSPKAVR